MEKPVPGQSSIAVSLDMHGRAQSQSQVNHL
ncbi:hypothetical protein BsWGS_29126 [Bradybaena similaris]